MRSDEEMTGREIQVGFNYLTCLLSKRLDNDSLSLSLYLLALRIFVQLKKKKKELSKMSPVFFFLIPLRNVVTLALTQTSIHTPFFSLSNRRVSFVYSRTLPLKSDIQYLVWRMAVRRPSGTLGSVGLVMYQRQ